MTLTRHDVNRFENAIALNNKVLAEFMDAQERHMDVIAGKVLEPEERIAYLKLIEAREQAMQTALRQMVDKGMELAVRVRVHKRMFWFNLVCWWISGFLARPFFDKYVFPFFFN